MGSDAAWIVQRPRSAMIERIDGIALQGEAVFVFQAEDGIRVTSVTGVQTCALPISLAVMLPLAALAVGARVARADEPPRSGLHPFVGGELGWNALGGNGLIAGFRPLRFAGQIGTSVV